MAESAGPANHMPAPPIAAMPTRMHPQKGHGESFARFSGARSTRADTPKSTVMFAKNDTTTINVLYWGVSAAPVSRMELRKVSMLQAQKNARPR